MFLKLNQLMKLLNIYLRILWKVKVIFMKMMKISLFLSKRKSGQNMLKLFVGQLNVDSIRNKFETVQEIIQNTFDIFLVCETKIDSSFPN